jgi:lipopolysaccharide export system protein LptA
VNNQLEQAVGTDGARLNWLGSPPARAVTADRITIDMRPGAEGAELHRTLAEGQSVVTMAAPAPTERAPNPAARELRADRIATAMFPGGQFMKKSEAEGNAVLTVTPVKAVAGADRRRLTAQRMHLTFFEEGNLSRELTADGGVKAEFEPLANDGRLPRTTTSASGRAEFDKASQDVSRLDQAGEFKYVEGDRNAVSGRATYTTADDLIALRDPSSSGRPTVWDSKSRSQGDEIDIRPNAQTSHGRGDVRTTYYSPATTGDGASGKSVPFGNTKSPVFVTSQRLDARQSDGGVGVFTGQARAWQDDNYVKADVIRLFNQAKRMEAEGNVESALYQMKRKDAEKGTQVVPVFTTASRMTYSDVERHIHYEGSVTSRQAPDVITSNTQDVWLTHGERAEVDHMVAAGGVVAVEPGRKGTGDRLVYTSADQKCVLTGSNARVEDATQGTSTGSELTYFIGGDRIQSAGHGAGRVKTTHRIKRKEAP